MAGRDTLINKKRDAAEAIAKGAQDLRDVTHPDDARQTANSIKVWADDVVEAVEILYREGA